MPPQFANTIVTWAQIFLLLFFHPFILQRCSSTLCEPAYIIHFACQFSKLLIHLWLILQQVIYTEFDSIFQYFSTTLITSLNYRPNVNSCFLSVFLLIVMIIAESHLFLVSYCSRSRFLDISQHGNVINYMPVKDLTSGFITSIFLFPKYLSRDMSCTLSHCQYSYISTPITNKFTVFATWISKLNNQRISSLAFAFLIWRVDIVSNGVYFTQENCVSNLFLAFCNVLLKAIIISVFDFCWSDTS